MNPLFNLIARKQDSIILNAQGNIVGKSAQALVNQLDA